MGTSIMKFKYLFVPLVAFSFLTGCEQPSDSEATEPAPDSPATTETPAVVVEEEVAVTLEEEPAATPAAPPAASEEATLPDPVATVNGQPISRDEFEKTLNEIFASMGMQVNMLPPDQRGMLYRQFIEDMVVDKLIDQASASTEVTEAEVDQELANIAQQYGSQERFAEELAASGQSLDEFKNRLNKLIRQRKWMESQIGSEDTVTEADARAFYDENTAEFEQPDVVRASHILIRVDEDADEETVAAAQKKAADLAAQARGGADFGALAEEFSEDPTAKQNAGDLNFFPKDRMVPEFAEAAFAMEVDTISDPVRTNFGWHVIKVTDKKEAQTLPFDDVKNDIMEYLKENKQQQAVEGVISKLREDAQVEIFIAEPATPSIDTMMEGMQIVVPDEN
jgi:peptidyl-prolyl cis-trans isomerase C